MDTPDTDTRVRREIPESPDVTEDIGKRASAQSRAFWLPKLKEQRDRAFSAERSLAHAEEMYTQARAENRGLEEHISLLEHELAVRPTINLDRILEIVAQGDEEAYREFQEEQADEA